MRTVLLRWETAFKFILQQVSNFNNYGNMKKNKYYLGTLAFIITVIAILQSCASSKEMIANKPGVQLWAENCIRCHHSPSPADFNDDQWKTMGLHMQVRASLTNDETEKIVEFLKSAN